eukprot:m.350948 g.350948  ORF g.350948 m.350948 type:complete len:497 (-) comp16161_c0_seq1:497-1987(-)
MAMQRWLMLALVVAALLIPATANLCNGLGIEFQCVSEGCPEDCDSDMFVCTELATPVGNFTKGCNHVNIFQGNIGKDIGVLVLLFVFLALASAGGIGGGGIIIPMLSAVTLFPPYYTIPLSVTSIVGGSIIRFFIQVRQHHPEARVAHRPLIDYNVVLCLLPSALAGTVLGVLLNSVSPGWLVIVCMFIVLTLASVKTLSKGITLYKQEKAQKNGKQAIDAAEAGEEGAKRDEIELADMPCKLPEAEVCTTLSQKDRDMEWAAIKESESKFPWVYIAITFTQLAGLIVLSLVRGYDDFVEVECGRGQYWGVTSSIFVYLMLWAAFGIWYVKRLHERKLACGYEFVEGDIDYSGSKIYKYPVFAIAAGVMAGFLGIGGGMLLGPLLLQLGMVPLVSSATTSFMTLFTSMSSTTQYLVLNRVPAGYGAALFGLAMVSSALGQFVVLGYVKRTGRNSLIAFILSFIIILSTILLVIMGVLDIVADAREGLSFGFRSLCD